MPCATELSVGLGVLDLEDVQLDLLAGELLEVGADALGLGAAATDHDARAGGVDVDANAVTRALDLDVAHSGAVEVRLQELADLDVLGHVVGVALSGLRRVGEPTRHVVGGDAEAEAVRVYLLAHYLLAFLVLAAGAASAASGVESTTVMWLVRFLIWNARPWARGRKRLSVVPSSTYALATYRSCSSRYSLSLSALTRAFAIAAATELADRLARRLRRELQDGEGLLGLLALDEGDDTTSLLRGHADVSHTCDGLHHFSLLLSRLAATALLVVLLVAAEGAGGREFAQLVADHGLGHEHGMCLRPSCTRSCDPAWPGRSSSDVTRS
jgi:hypothetical protein